MSQILPLQGAVRQEIIASGVLLNWMVFILAVSHRDPLVFSLPFLPIMWHLQVNRLSGGSSLRFQCPISGPTLTARFLDVHTFIVSTPDLKDTYIAVCPAIPPPPLNNNKLQAKSHDQPDAAIHLLAEQRIVPYACMSFFGQKTTVNALFLMFNTTSTFKCLINGNCNVLCWHHQMMPLYFANQSDEHISGGLNTFSFAGFFHSHIKNKQHTAL